MTIDTVKKLAALAAGVGCGPLSLRLFTVLGVPVGGPARDSVAPLAFWLASSPIAQVCAAALFIGSGARYGWPATWPNRDWGSRTVFPTKKTARRPGFRPKDDDVPGG